MANPERAAQSLRHRMMRVADERVGDFQHSRAGVLQQHTRQRAKRAEQRVFGEHDSPDLTARGAEGLKEYAFTQTLAAGGTRG